jgi:uncharacterized protein (DUF58 family)
VRFLLRILYLANRGFSGLRYRAERRFTPAGLAVFAALILTGFMAVDTDNNVDYQAFALLFFLLLTAVLFSLWFRGRFAVERVLPRFATAGCPLTYTVRMQNLGSASYHGLSLLETLEDPRPPFEEWMTAQLREQKRLRSFRIGQPVRAAILRDIRVKPAAVPPLAAAGQVETKIELTPVRRGLLRFKGVALTRPDPLGLCCALRQMPLPQSILVLPRRYPLPPVAMPGRMKYQPGGVAQASNVGQSDEFVAVRDYRSGDPLRHIHWRSWARVGKPVVREFEDEFFVRHALVLDTFAEEDPDVFEEAVSVAASFACTVQSQEALLDLLFVGTQSYCFTAGRGLAHSDQLLEVLASVRPCAGQDFSLLEGLVLNHINIVSGCICVLLAWDKARRELVRKIRALGIPVRALVVTPAGGQAKLDPGPLSDSPESFHVLPAGDIERGLASLK